jgi:hypothetical protein
MFADLKKKKKKKATFVDEVSIRQSVEEMCPNLFFRMHLKVKLPLLLKKI